MRLFVLHVLVCVCLCLFPLPLDVSDWLRLLIVALPVLFVLPFGTDIRKKATWGSWSGADRVRDVLGWGWMGLWVYGVGTSSFTHGKP